MRTWLLCLALALSTCGGDDDTVPCEGDGTLPPENSACATMGEICEGPTILCGKSPHMRCVDGVWIEEGGAPCGDPGSGATTTD